MLKKMSAQIKMAVLEAPTIEAKIGIAIPNEVRNIFKASEKYLKRIF